jgi:hypothetical protein
MTETINNLQRFAAELDANGLAVNIKIAIAFEMQGVEPYIGNNFFFEISLKF